MDKRIVELQFAHRLLGGNAVALVATRYRDRVNVMPASWITPISMKPPMLAIAVSKNCLTHDYIERSGEFTLSLPGIGLLEKVHAAGMISGYDCDDKLEEVGLRPVVGEALDTPVIEGCLGYLECTVEEAYEAGEEHTLFVATVVAAYAEREAFDDTWLLTEEEAKPLRHLGGHLYSVLSQRISAEPKATDGQDL